MGEAIVGYFQVVGIRGVGPPVAEAGDGWVPGFSDSAPARSPYCGSRGSAARMPRTVTLWRK
jgi:hypothetical protein